MWQPHPNFIEASGGPEELKFIEWIEIERCERRHMGRLVQAKWRDHSDRIRATLEAERATFVEAEESFKILGYTRPQIETSAEQAAAPNRSSALSLNSTPSVRDSEG
jgi:hypothetical protein